MGCGKSMGGAMGYSRRCGSLWMGNISLCDKCRRQEMRDEILRLQLEKARLEVKKLNKGDN